VAWPLWEVSASSTLMPLAIRISSTRQSKLQRRRPEVGLNTMNTRAFPCESSENLILANQCIMAMTIS
jgi:hypothetical protein